MDIERANPQPLTAADLQQLETLEELIRKCAADGIITRDELDAIKVQIAANGKVMVEELDLVRQFIREKVSKGDLVIEYFG